MKAVRIHARGGVDTLRYEDVPEPTLSFAGDAVVKLKAASVNHSDIRVPLGVEREDQCVPRILGSDGAGVVVDLGAGVTHVHRGDRVCLYPIWGCGSCQFCSTDQEHLCPESRMLGRQEDGTYAEYVRVPARNCFRVPETLSLEQAAAVPLVFITLWRMLITRAELRPGESVLIMGTGGGVALAALQVAVRVGAQVIVGSSSAEKSAKAKTFGAQHAIADGSADFVQQVRQLTGKRGVDVVVDCVGGRHWAKSLACLAKGGRLVTCGTAAGDHPKTDIRRLFWNHLKIFGSTLGTRGELRQVLNFIEITRMHPIIDRIFPLQEAAAAQQWMADQRHFGKIILRMDH